MKFCLSLFSLILLFVLPSCQQKSEPKNISAVPEFVPEHFHLPILADTMTIFGEVVDLTDLDNRERLDKELHTIVYRHSHIFLYFRRANRYFDLIETELVKQNVPADFKYLALVESGLEQGTSTAGAQGFWQFMPKTAAEYGMRVNKETDERRNFILSTVAAASYLRLAHDNLESWIAAAASYNRGVAGLRTDMRKQSVKSFFDTYLNSETSRYVFRIMAMKLIFENPKAYGFNLSKMERYSPLVLRFEKVERIDNLTEWALEHNSNKKIVLLLNPWILGDKLSKRAEGYEIALPKDEKQFQTNQ